MALTTSLSLFLLTALLSTNSRVSVSAIASINETFLQCLSHAFSSTEMYQIIYFPNTTSYTNLLQSTIQNLRFSTPAAPKPLLIITPTNESQIQASVLCCKKYGIQIRIRSGGHDYEGLPYMSPDPFIVVDLLNFRSVTVDLEDNTAWVQSGATLGELYYGIAKKSRTLGFPGGLCPTVGVGGQFSGGGIGTLIRKYGLASDNIIDAYLVDSDGRVLNRKSMGKDLFWAIRGGGGGSFGIILSWRLKLVQVPPTVTVFNVGKTLEEGATELVSRWSQIADKLHDDIFIRVVVQNINITGKLVQGGKVLQASFNSLFLGTIKELLPLMKKSFPELGLEGTDCTEMSWIESVLYFAGYLSGSPTEVLLGREPPYGKTPFKGKSDFAKKPISRKGLEGVWRMFQEEEMVFMIMDPLGGKMSEVSKSETPFPHREGYLCNIQYLVKWEESEKELKRHLDWMERLYGYMEPHVSDSPRGAYFNYRDLDLGMNEGDNTGYSTGRVWGRKYFKSNFRRLARVKGVVDRDNFFRNEQSVPPLLAEKRIGMRLIGRNCEKRNANSRNLVFSAV